MRLRLHFFLFLVFASCKDPESGLEPIKPIEALSAPVKVNQNDVFKVETFNNNRILSEIKSGIENLLSNNLTETSNFEWKLKIYYMGNIQTMNCQGKSFGSSRRTPWGDSISNYRGREICEKEFLENIEIRLEDQKNGKEVNKVIIKARSFEISGLLSQALDKLIKISN